MNEDLPDQVVEEFLSNLEQAVDRIKTELKSENFSFIERLGHALSGSGSTYGFDEISELGNRLEDAAHNQENEEIETVLHQLSRKCEEIQSDHIQEQC